MKKKTLKCEDCYVTIRKVDKLNLMAMQLITPFIGLLMMIPILGVYIIYGLDTQDSNEEDWYITKNLRVKSWR